MTTHRQDEQWDKALREHAPIVTGRLDLASYTVDGEPIRYLYCDAWPDRIAIIGDHCDIIAYAANRVQPLMSEIDRLRERERRCPTMQEAEARSLLRALQEIAGHLGMNTEQSSPAQIVAAVRSLQSNAEDQRRV